MKVNFPSKKKIILILFVSPILLLIVANVWIPLATEDKLYNDIESIPNRRVGLVLGTIKQLGNDNLNRYYQYRIDAAVQLYEAKKADYLLVSGDNSRKGYDEPSTIKEDLVARGIPASKIYLDYAGFRTLDSIVRAKKIFGLQQFTVISQQFHNERAVFISQLQGIDAIGYNAQSVPFRAGFKVWLREKLARAKVLIDYAFGVGPKFLGEKVLIE